MEKQRRGFASMDKAKQRDIASKGGRAAHQKGVAHQWTGGPTGSAASAARKSRSRLAPSTAQNHDQGAFE